MPTVDKIQISLVQMQNRSPKGENLKIAIEQIRKAASMGSQLVCLQELFESAYFCQEIRQENFELAQPIPGETTHLLAKLAAELEIVLISSQFEKDGTQFYNTAVVFDTDGSIAGTYRKVHIPNDPKSHYMELDYFTPGDGGIQAVQTRLGKIGVLVCWDQWYPEAARTLALQGARIIFYPTAIGWNKGQRNLQIGNDELEAWLIIQRSHAIANGVFIASCNRTGLEDHIEFWGNSFICNPYGRYLAHAGSDTEEILTATCDFSEIKKYTEDWPFLECRRSESYFQPWKKPQEN